jgi:hypothetical protein
MWPGEAQEPRSLAQKLRHRQNVTWRALSMALPGFCHIMLSFVVSSGSRAGWGHGEAVRGKSSNLVSGRAVVDTHLCCLFITL